MIVTVFDTPLTLIRLSLQTTRLSPSTPATLNGLPGGACATTSLSPAGPPGRITMGGSSVAGASAVGSRAPPPPAIVGRPAVTLPSPGANFAK